MQRRHFLGLCSSLAAASLASPAQAQLAIEISGAGARRIPIAIANFEGEAALGSSLSDVIRDDLERCGLFLRVDAGAAPIAETAVPDWNAWRSRSADNLLAGSVRQIGSGRFEVRFQLFDVVRQQAVPGAGMVVSFNTDTTRAAGHRIADVVYEKLIGERGAFGTRIAYVEKSGSRYALQVADADGRNAVAALYSREPIMSPAWSPDGKSIAYVAFESKKPVIYVRELTSERRPVLANFKGSNSAPAWAPDGRSLVVMLTKEGPSQLYHINADGSGVRRLTHSSAIDTEPCFSPDGKYIYFLSDRGGSPQIYRLPAQGGEVQRVTFDGGYNVSPAISPDGKTLAYISRNSGRFQVTVMDLESRRTRILTDSTSDESPSFSPNGRFILYATASAGRDVLAAVSVDGKTSYRLMQASSDIREPTWGPFM